MRYFIIIGVCILMSLDAFTQVSLPYYSGFDSAAERIGWKQYRLGQDDTFDYGFNGYLTVTDPNCLYHDYPVGGVTITDDWFVSPELSLPNGGQIDSIWFNTSGFGIPQGIDTIALYAIYGNKDPELASSKILLASISDSSYTMYPEWQFYTNIPIPASNEPCHFAIRYKTVSNWITIRVDNIYISEATTTSTNQFQSRDVIVYPNPVIDDLYFSFENKVKVNELEIYNYQGALLTKSKLTNDRFDLSHLDIGMYFLKLYTDNEEKVYKIIKEK